MRFPKKICIPFFVAMFFPMLLVANAGPSIVQTPFHGMNLAPQGRSIFYQHNYIQLVSELLTIQLGRNGYSVTVKYLFKNHGPKQTVQTAFPYIFPVQNFKVFQNKNSLVPVRSYEPFKKIIGWFSPVSAFLPILDERAISGFGGYNQKYVTPISGAKIKMLLRDLKSKRVRFANYKLFSFSFTKGEPKSVTIRYKSKYGISRLDSAWLQNRRLRSVNYILQTGGYWRGVINSLKIKIQLAAGLDWQQFEPVWSRSTYGADAVAALIPFITPAKFVLKERSVEWEFKNVALSKKHDINLAFIKKRRQRTRRVKARSSSILAPDFMRYHGVQSFIPKHRFENYGLMFYSPYRMLDRSVRCCWAEGVEGPGIGEWVEFIYPTKQKKKQIGIINGIAISVALYKQNNRVKEAELVFDDKTRKRILFKDNVRRHQYFSVPVAFKKVRIIIKSVYKGGKFNSTCLQYLTFK